MKKKTTFEFDTHTTKLLDELQSVLHVNTKADVIRRSLKIAGTLAKAEDEGSKLYIKEKGEDSLSRVILV
jgi:hypothetical protein